MDAADADVDGGQHVSMFSAGLDTFSGISELCFPLGLYTVCIRFQIRALDSYSGEKN